MAYLLVEVMKPIYFTIDDHLPIMAIPNVKVHSDGHPVLTYSYNIFYDRSHEEPELITANRNIIQDKLNNPDYCGCLAFEDPERLFSFTPDGKRELSHSELEEIVEHLKHYRDNPQLWNHTSN